MARALAGVPAVQVARPFEIGYVVRDRQAAMTSPAVPSVTPLESFASGGMDGKEQTRFAVNKKKGIFQ